jgi:hypothetical protein
MSTPTSVPPTRSQRGRAAFAAIAANLLLVIVSLAVSAAFIEAGSWLWVRFFMADHLTRWEFRATQPPPYRGGGYFGPEFLKESESSVSGRFGDVVELANFQGKYFNILGGMRVTTDVPRQPVKRVLMFGGSTLFGQEVPDRYTIASYLQRQLNAAGVRWEVKNYGLPGMNAAQQTRILKTVEVRKGDIVVFYHGVNEIYYTVFGGYRDGWKSGVPAFRPVQKLSALHRILHDWHERFKDYSFTAQVALDIYQRAEPSTITDPEELRRNTDVAAEHFANAVSEAAAFARSAGAEFVHFLQPQVFANARLTPYEERLIANPLQTPPGLGTAFSNGYPRLRAAAESIRKDAAFVDISGALDGRPQGEEVFLDFCHIAHQGNERIARRIFDDYFRARVAR